MKYLFFIHSNTCLILAESIISARGFLRRDVVFLVSREVTVENINNIQVPYRVYYALGPRLKALTPKGVFDNLYALLWCKSIIHTLDNFTVFCHNNRDLKQNIFIRHKRCVEAHFFEDGVDFLVNEETYQKKYPTYGVMNLVKAYALSVMSGCWGYRVYSDPLCSNQSTVYVLTEYSLRWKNCKKEIVTMQPLHDMEMEEQFDIWIPSGLVKQGIVSADVYSQFWQYIATNHRFGESVYIKFHPAQSSSERQEIKKIALEYYDLVIETDVTIENVARQGNHKFIGCGSGLLAYCRLLNETNKVSIGYKVLERINCQRTPRSAYWDDLYSNDLYKDNLL